MRAPTTARAAAGRPVDGPAPARDVYAEVTARIVTALEAGVTPWVELTR